MMFKRLPYLIFMLLVAASVACNRQPQKAKHVWQPQDSVYSEEAALDVYATDPERALVIIDSAEVVGNVSDFRADFLRALVFSKSFNAQRQDTAIVLCETLMQHDSVKASPRYKQQVLELLVNASRMRQDYGMLVEKAAQLVDLFREEGLLTEALRTEAEIGLALTNLGQEEEGMAKIDGAIKQLEGVRRFNEMDAVIIAIRRKVSVLSQRENYEEVIRQSDHILKLLDDYEANPDVYHDNSYREPEEDGRFGYIDFNRAMMCLYKADAYACMGNHEAARSEVERFRQTNYSKTVNGRVQVASILGQLGDYDTMLEYYEEAEQRMIHENDTMSISYAQILRDRALAANAKGRYAETQALWMRYDRLREMLNDSLQRSKAHMYAALYHAREQQLELKHEQAKSLLAFVLASVLLMLCLLVITYAWIVSRQRKLTERKNRVLAEQISEAIVYKDKVGELERRLAVMKTAVPPSSPGKEAAGADAEADVACGEGTVCDAASLEEMSNDELFNYISRVVVAEQLYLNPTFDRKTIMNRFGISARKIGAAFSKGSTYKALPDFTRKLRLEHACRLLSTNRDLSVKAVGEASGFSNNSTFCSDFKKCYDMTPSEYRGAAFEG